MDDNLKQQIVAVLKASLHNLGVVSDQLNSLNDVDGVDVDQVKELDETKASIVAKLMDLRK
jgi:hypothetical protein